MLILTRKPGESLYIGDNVKVVVVEVKGSQVRIGIEADKSLRIYREEIYLQILEENKNAAAGAQSTEAGLEGLGSWKGRKDARPEGEARGMRSLSVSPLASKPVDGEKICPGCQKPMDKCSCGKAAAGPEVVVRKKKKSDE